MNSDPDPFEQGERAARQDIPAEANPYQDGSEQHALRGLRGGLLRQMPPFGAPVTVHGHPPQRFDQQMSRGHGVPLRQHPFVHAPAKILRDASNATAPEPALEYLRHVGPLTGTTLHQLDGATVTVEPIIELGDDPAGLSGNIRRRGRFGGGRGQGLARGAPSLRQEPHHAGEKPHQQRKAGKLTADAEIHVGHLRIAGRDPPSLPKDTTASAGYARPATPPVRWLTVPRCGSRPRRPRMTCPRGRRADRVHRPSARRRRR